MNSKRIHLFTALGAFLVLLAVVVQYRIIVTSAQAVILPVVVYEEDLAFGTVFPGEEHEGVFTVHYVQEYEEDNVSYQIIQKRKPLPEGYQGQGDPEMPGYYRDLCPFLTKVSIEQEGDTEKLASVGKEDTSDRWIIYFKVPAILGNVSQDNQGGVVDEAGEYGCDISINVLE